MESTSRSLPGGIYAAVITFFDSDTENIDLKTQNQHIARLVKAGIAGFVIMGSNGEALHLSIEERSTIIRETRSCLDVLGKTQTPVIAGCSDQSVRDTVHLCREAALTGSDYAIVLSPSYFRGGMSLDVIERFFAAVVEYFPGVSAGIEMDSGLLSRVSQHLNVAGTRFTCGDTGKLSRAATAMKSRQPYAIFGGLADFILPALIAGATGSTRTKAALNVLFGYGGKPRQPLEALPQVSVLAMQRGLEKLVTLERLTVRPAL
ncbi:unnamed protein product [Clonostachys rosea]|uniref:Dihydrodipicolinate synthase family protein n=1 Tax=Bionectria ochroleuca TaxID=29856 RepID=A0ABY6U2M1_BIOOC|nr:unnamed protein product [Clonostachys rosea]